MLERIFDYISSHSGVRFTTFDAIADDFAKRYPRDPDAKQAAE
jgi:hypothetical protein